MDKKYAMEFAGLMEDFLNIPSMVCETIEKYLINDRYEEVIKFVVDRHKNKVLEEK